MSIEADEIRYRPKPRLLVRAVAGEAVLLDLDRGCYFGLNETGRRVWELVADDGATVKTALQTLESEFAAPAEELAADVSAVLGDLERQGLLLREGAGTASESRA